MSQSAEVAPVILASRDRMPEAVQGYCTSQLPVKVPGKVVNDSPNSWAPITMGYGVPGS